jgi:hypothetical protein
MLRLACTMKLFAGCEGEYQKRKGMMKYGRK